MNTVSDLFGKLVFNDKVMKERLPKATYKRMHDAIDGGMPLDLEVANVIANAMKDWAIENGATHFSHWFQPMTGITAEKHDSFISPTGDGKVIMEFSGKALIKGESDASSFPSGGIRSTFEARGYTSWDPSSYAFIKGKTLCIPTAFCSYNGEALDKKTPLLRSMEALNKQALRVLRAMGDNSTQKVISSVGSEQEYFLIDKDLYAQRKDLIYCGRTLLGANPPKTQELDDHFFGAIKPRVTAFMKDLDNELWALGVYAKTEHNEAAPCQFEIAPIYTETNIAADHNQLTMEIMKKVAEDHNLACLLHEKPFNGISGSGKHNNWSISTEKGENLLEPGKMPIENTKFLIFLVAVIKAVDEYQDLLRMSIASAGNEHRLGGHEAPPAIVSIFLGDELTRVLDTIESGEEYIDDFERVMQTKVQVLPDFAKDTTDRNRTSPFAFTGNKFEFRMLGSGISIAGPNIVMNSIMAEALSQFADRLEGAENVNDEIKALLAETITQHKRVIFNGDGYSKQWEEEADRRGLLNVKSTPEALKHYIADKNIAMFEKHGVFNRTEIRARYDIKVEAYCKTLNIEANTLMDMINRQIIPAVVEYSAVIADSALSKRDLDASIPVDLEIETVKELSVLNGELKKRVNKLSSDVCAAGKVRCMEERAKYFRETIFDDLLSVREIADRLETLVAEDYWPIPTYGEILNSI
ncbi:MAG: glutamine synthetase type III [Anaerofustis stercorihominis]|nr:glutamine synthetase type III [Anaerofustis stercorihominis]